MMQILALDTSALTASVAILRDGAVIAELSSTNRLNHSVRILPMVEQALSLADTTLAETDAFALSAGPGSFTGVRIGISTVKGLMFGTERLCAPVSTLEALAHNLAFTDAVICPLMDARRGEFYNALFEGRADSDGITRLTSDRAITGEALAAELSAMDRPILLCGDGARLFSSQFSPARARLAPPCSLVQRAVSVATVGEQMLTQGKGVLAQELSPLYLRQSGAERKKEVKSC